MPRFVMEFDSPEDLAAAAKAMAGEADVSMPGVIVTNNCGGALVVALGPGPEGKVQVELLPRTSEDIESNGQTVLLRAGQSVDVT